jgi:asparagine synthase (glutamine-hydrolysing)
MCGIALCFSLTDNPDQMTGRLSAIEHVQLHRGPDDQGKKIIQTAAGTLGLAQQRLSIIDLTDAGHQPMTSPCGRYSLVYNGEVFNYKELAEELGPDPILSISSGDTAVVLAALVRWGPDALSRFNGMWALAFVDNGSGRVVVARDRMGVKPLFYAASDTSIVFASEVKGVLAGNAHRRFQVNSDAVGRFLLQSLTSPGTETLFKGVSAFPAASFAVLDFANGLPQLAPQRFWHHPFEQPRPATTVTPELVRELLFDSVKLRLRSDVPVGIMLSGGLDSSCILAAAREMTNSAKIKALSVVSRDPIANEEPFIDLMARHAECEVIKIQTDDDPVALWDDLERSVWHYDHPVSSFSNIAHRRIMQSAKDNGIVVLLTGQGADEQLGGYNKFLYFYLWDRLRKGSIAGPASMLAGCLANGTIINEFKLSHAKRYIPFLRSRAGQNWVGPRAVAANLINSSLGRSYEEREFRDMTQLSLPDLLTSEDRASMSLSREMRTPFLDYRFVETLAAATPDQKLSKGWTKHILRQAMAPYLPKEICWRKDKKGYTVPGKAWMTGALRSRVEAVLDEPLIAAQEGYIDQSGVREMFASLISGKAGTRYEDVLSVISLEYWLRSFKDQIEFA